jgi:hypothetical protein
MEWGEDGLEVLFGDAVMVADDGACVVHVGRVEVNDDVDEKEDVESEVGYARDVPLAVRPGEDEGVGNLIKFLWIRILVCRQRYARIKNDMAACA